MSAGPAPGIPADELHAVPQKARLVTVALAALGAVAVWAIAELGLGIDLRSPVFPDGSQHDVDVQRVLVVAVVGSLVGWALLAALERFTVRGPRLWVALATVALLLSLGGPFGGSGITTSNRIALAAMHVVVGGIVIGGLYRSSPRRVDHLEHDGQEGF